jgi:flagellar export protein FliJ
MEVKERLLEQKQRDLEAALIAVQETLTKINEVDNGISETYHEMTTRCLYGKEMSTMIEHIAFLDNSKIQLIEEKKERQAFVENARKELWELEVDLKMLEKLKSKILNTIKKARSRKDQKLMDELALRVERH